MCTAARKPARRAGPNCSPTSETVLGNNGWRPSRPWLRLDTRTRSRCWNRFRFARGTAPEIRVAAANALLRIERRDFRGLGWVDWLVVAVYGAFMLGVGWYYSRRQTNTEEYFLGSRSLGSFVIGISL